MPRVIRATFQFNDLRLCLTELPLIAPMRRRIEKEIARLNDGGGDRVEITLKQSQLRPRLVEAYGIDTELTLIQAEPRAAKLPAYLGGEVAIPMLDCTLDCTGVFVPREHIVLTAEHILAQLATMPRRGRTFFDLGCGSGVLGIAAKKRYPELRVVCSDISADAVAITKKNAQTNGVDIEVVRGNMFAPLPGKKCDYVCFFGPQSPRADWSPVEGHYSEYIMRSVAEPIVAFASGKDGLGLLAPFCRDLPRHLKPGGTAWLMLGSTRYLEVINWLSPAFTCHAETKPPLRDSYWWFTRR